MWKVIVTVTRSDSTSSLLCWKDRPLCISHKIFKWLLMLMPHNSLKSFSAKAKLSSFKKTILFKINGRLVLNFNLVRRSIIPSSSLFMLLGKDEKSHLTKLCHKNIQNTPFTNVRLQYDSLLPVVNFRGWENTLISKWIVVDSKDEMITPSSSSSNALLYWE